MRSKLLQLAVTLVAILVWSASAIGCSCLGDETVCETFGKASAVFVGTPTSVTTARETATDNPAVSWTVRKFKFTVEQSFMGVAGAEVEVQTRTDCGYDFMIGRRYLVYAFPSRNGDQLAARHCTRTKPYSEADEDIKYLDSLRSAVRGVTIYGEVSDRPYGVEDGDAGTNGEHAGFALSIEGAGEKREIRTDAQGHYRLSGLAPGKYEVTVLLPDELTVYYPTREVTVSDRGCAVINYYLRDNGRVSGRAVDLAGRPGNSVLISLVDADGEGAGRRVNEFATTDEEGRFSFSMIPEGRYLLGVNTARHSRLDEDTNAYPRSYYPGVAEASQATLIDVGRGEKVSDLNLRLLPRRAARPIRVTVMGPDGKPVAKARIRFRDATYYESRTATTTTCADEQGELIIDAYDDQILEIEVSDDPADASISGFSVPKLVAPVRIMVSSQTEQVKLVIKRRIEK